MVETKQNDNQVSETLWEEIADGLMGDDPAGYIQNLRDTGELEKVLPEVNSLFGVPQSPEHHPEIDTGVHTMMALTKATELKGGLAVRFATLVHDLGKGLTDPDHWPKHHGHEELGIPPVEDVTSRLGTPKEIVDLAMHVARYHLHAHRALELKPKTLVSLLERTDALDNPEMFEQFIVATQADAQGRLGLEDKPYPQADFLRATLKAAQEIETQDLIEGGLSGSRLDEQVRTRMIDAVREVKQGMEMDTLS